MVGASKIFAPDSGRSKMRRQIPSSSISRRIMDAVPVAVIGLILARFFEIPSGVWGAHAPSRAAPGALARRTPDRGRRLSARAPKTAREARALPRRLRSAKASVKKLGARLHILLRHPHGRE